MNVLLFYNSLCKIIIFSSIIISFTSVQSARLAHKMNSSHSHMGCRSAPCDRRFPSEHPGCRSPSGTAGIPETNRLACVGVQWPAAGMRNTQTRGLRGKEAISTPGEASRPFKAQRRGHRHCTPIKYPFPSPSGSWHSMLGTSPGGSLPFTELQATPTLSIPSRNSPVHKSHANVRCGLSLCTAAHALTYRAHASRNPAWILMPPDPRQVHKPLGQQKANLQQHTANFSCHIQLN